MSFVYGLVYPFLSAYPIVLQGVCGMNLGAGGLVIGQLLAGLYILLIQGQYGEKLVANPEISTTACHGRSCLLCRWHVLGELIKLE
jgi:hypothetical protein